MSDWRDVSFKTDQNPPMPNYGRVVLAAWHAHEMADDFDEQGSPITVAALTIGHRHVGGDKAHSHIDEWADWLDTVSDGPERI